MRRIGWREKSTSRASSPTWCDANFLKGGVVEKSGFTLNRLRLIDKPAAQVILSRLRDSKTPRSEFRRLLYKAGIISAYEISNEVPLTETSVETPLGVRAKGFEYGCDVTVIAVLRAALPMAWGMLEVFEDAKVGFVSAKRAEVDDAESREFSLEVELSYMSVPERSGVIIVVDPMLATGSTLSAVLRKVTERVEAVKIIVSALIATEVGVKRILSEHGGITMYAFAVDPQLNSRAFIVPGLGDAGDRAFG
ncbi:uracil phosphoribosyltransferase [Infirmifilum sp. SLHALR2]|nr:MAG: uracil phosphoribosyltransferase [Thermofilum sp. NZ13]